MFAEPEGFLEACLQVDYGVVLSSKCFFVFSLLFPYSELLYNHLSRSQANRRLVLCFAGPQPKRYKRQLRCHYVSAASRGVVSKDF